MQFLRKFVYSYKHINQKCELSRKPYVADESEALMNLLQGFSHK